DWCLLPPTPTNWSCMRDTTAWVDGTYEITLVVTDWANNNSVEIKRTIVLDNQPPVSSFVQFTEVAGTQYQHAVGNRLYYNPAQSGTVKIEVTASDAGTGMNRVHFPDIDGANTEWSPAGIDESGVGPNYAQDFSWTP